MCKRCLISFLIFLAIVAFAFFFIFRTAAKGATMGVIINEIAWAGSTNSPNDEWMELYNPSAETIALKGWKLEAADGSPSIALQGEIPSGGYFLLERTNDESVPSVKANQLYTGSLDNKGEDLKLIDANGMVRDEVNAADGWPAGDNTTKATMARDDSNLAVVSWGNGPVNGTPLAQNIIVAAPPKPSNPRPEGAPLGPAKTAAIKTGAKTNKTTQNQTQNNASNTTPPNAADIAAFNSRVQQTAQENPAPSGIKDIAGALSLLAIGAVAAYTIFKKRKKNFEEL